MGESSDSAAQSRHDLPELSSMDSKQLQLYISLRRLQYTVGQKLQSNKLRDFSSESSTFLFGSADRRTSCLPTAVLRSLSFFVSRQEVRGSGSYWTELASCFC